MGGRHSAGGTMEHFDESWDEAAAEGEPDLDSDPEELWRSLIADEAIQHRTRQGMVGVLPGAVNRGYR